jgi:hypothetical protein
MASKKPPSKKKDQGLPLGVDEGYTAPKQGVKSYGDTNEDGSFKTSRYGYSEIRPHTYQQAPTFYDAHLDRPVSWSPAAIAGLQSDLVGAGLLSQKGFSLGIYDDATRNAYKKVLSYANRAGITSIDEALGVFLRSPKGGSGGGGSKRAPFRAELPNPEDIKAVIDATVPNLIGRTLSAQEKDAVVAAYTAVVTGAQRSAYNTAETGGAVTAAPDVGTFVKTRAKELYGEEADVYDKFTRTTDAMRILGIGGQSEGPQAFQVRV